MFLLVSSILASLLQAPSALILAQGRSDRVANLLKSVGLKVGSLELLELSDSARQPDQLDKVKDMIRNMIAHHQTALAEDTDHKAFCDKELTLSAQKVKQRQDELQKRTADQDLHSAQLAEMKDKISELHDHIATAHKDKLKASNLREKEAAAYKKQTEDWDRRVLELRGKLRSDIQAERESARQEQEDIALKKVRAENKEEDAQFTYKKLDQEFAVAIASKTREVELKERQVVSMTHNLSLGDGDFKMAKEELAASKEYADKVKASCVVMRDPVQQRQQARQDQISSLKEAYTILSGDDIPR
jgi:ribosomal protein S15P/S13E|mmetsp:Transcript_37961/g.60125  ORF Transcript_37961/g.60125 Transcript_37961/m.60125 type:complete len:303 (+) Transcript_37961:102-1010(+)